MAIECKVGIFGAKEILGKKKFATKPNQVLSKQKVDIFFKIVLLEGNYFISKFKVDLFKVKTELF